MFLPEYVPGSGRMRVKTRIEKRLLDMLRNELPKNHNRKPVPGPKAQAILQRRNAAVPKHSAEPPIGSSSKEAAAR
jgi:hypothetical protein